MKKSLEALVIPTGTLEDCEKRTEIAMKECSQREHKPYVLVTGELHRDENGRPKKTQQYFIYKQLREEYGLKPSDMIIEGRSSDSLENFLYTLEKAKKKGLKRILISTNPTHYWRFKLYESEARREGLIDDSFEIIPIYTKESLRSFIYGLLAFIKDYYRIKTSPSLEEARKRKTKVRISSFIKKSISD